MAGGANKPVSADGLTTIKCIITICVGKAIIEGQGLGKRIVQF